MPSRADVVTCFLRNRGEVLLCRRADDAASYPGRWAGVSGYVEEDDPAGTARREIREETGIDRPTLVRAGEPFAVVDEDLAREWVVHPFLFDVPSREVRLDPEHREAEWVPAPEIRRRETVPELWTAYARVAPTVESVAADEAHGATALSIRALEVLRDAAALAAERGADRAAVEGVAERLIAARPSMAVLRNRIDRAMAGADTAAAVEWSAVDGIDRALAADAGATEAAAERVADADVLTLSRSGTVLEALRTGGPTHVLVAESRPAAEGVGVAEALGESGLAVTLCTDAAVAHVLSEHRLDAVVVGADTVLPDGTVVNKTGTRAAALAAAREGIPLWVAAATDKVSPEVEVALEAGDPAAVYDGPAPVAAINPTFDRTPPDLVAALLTERGELDPDDVAAVADEHRVRAAWRAGRGEGEEPNDRGE